MTSRYITSSITALNSPFLSVKNTGLGNVLYQVSSVYGISKQLNIKCVFPYVKILGDKLKSEYNYDHNDTIFRHIPLDNSVHFNEQINENYNLMNYIQQSHNNIIIEGYLGGKYFENCKEDIVNMFSPDEKSLDYINDKYFSKMDSYTIVSIHFRGNEFGPEDQPDKEFYKKAYNYVLDKVETPFFYIFTDDYDKIDLSYFKDENYKIIGKEFDYIHLWMMSKCKHNIISFSTLAWWGAYLNTNPNKMVICCKTYRYFDFKDLILI